MNPIIYYYEKPTSHGVTIEYAKLFVGIKPLKSTPFDNLLHLKHTLSL
jgi:hypothetical protein